jgi:S-adenosylmethionine synthetase
MTNRIVVSQLVEPSIAEQAFELAECKGIGHPDVLCDGIAERISYNYVQWCLTNLGGVLHHNFDKIMLVAGESRVSFGHGELLKPIRIQVGGRATRFWEGRQVPVDSIVQESAINYLQEAIRCLDPSRNCLIDCLVRQGDSRLANLAARRVANDTISCCAFWPRSPLEETVYMTAGYINRELAALVPIGEDAKVSAYRLDGRMWLVVAVPFLAREVKSLELYEASKRQAAEYIRRFATSVSGGDVEVTVNAADDCDSGKVYITLTGTSAEMADDGSVGRGNRACGFVAPFRPSSTPPAGKNPISHPGKVYNIVAMRIAREVVEAVPEIKESRVLVFAVIGQPLNEPALTNVSVRTGKPALESNVNEKVAAVTRSILNETEDIMRGLLKAYPRLY